MDFLKEIKDSGFKTKTITIVENKMYGIKIYPGKNNDDWDVIIDPLLVRERIKQVNIKNKDKPYTESERKMDERFCKEGMIYFDITKETAIWVVNWWIDFAQSIGFYIS